ncbi:acetylglutamate kinase [Ktedonobacter racemifer]|uniref:Acetylglutamate kinase n=1 Tax=Ktedonobacter racemifer DSM 44963 TaxID=485913 RepID=D6TBZ6_KTERA|nr:acetylglutamate kinase [Ktedonobacter racemifer]EFH88032.1 acetylglutamate kinase [Ktedonobacter racemifer DSM 44963]
MVTSSLPATKQPLCENDLSSTTSARKSRRTFSRLKGKTFVVKLGGSALEHQRTVIQDCICLHALGASIVLVHGGGPVINEWLTKLHVPIRFEHGLRVTDAQTLEIVRMVLCGQINQELVAMATQLGGDAVGLCGTDGNIVRGHIADESLGFVGEIDAIHPMLVRQVLDDGYIPIIAPLGLGPDGSSLNMNADLVASRLAAALQASRLTFLSDIDGIYGSDGSLISEMNEAEAHTLIERGVIKDGMIPKVNACLHALEDVPCVQIANGCTSHVLLHTLEDLPLGTKFVR